MIKFGKIVDASASVEEQPNHNNRRKRASDLRCPERLNSKQENKNGAGHSDNGGRANARFGNFDTLDGTKYRLSRSQDTISLMPRSQH